MILNKIIFHDKDRLQKLVYLVYYWHKWTCLSLIDVIGRFSLFYIRKSFLSFFLQDIKMQRIFIFLSINVFFILMQYSNGARKNFILLWNYCDCLFLAREVRLLKNAEVDHIVKRFVNKLKPFMDDNSMVESDESNENKQKIVDALELISKSEESNSDNNEQENNDKEAILSNFINIDRQKVLQNSDEN